MTEFPKWKYHATEPARLVKSSIEEQALGAEWINSPVQAPRQETGQAPTNIYISPEEQKQRDDAHARVLLENQRLRDELAKRDAQKPEPAPAQPEAKPDPLDEVEKSLDEDEPVTDEAPAEEEKPKKKGSRR